VKQFSAEFYVQLGFRTS